ncbi:DUF4129 domain-containing protein [Chloroflexota bacterium]
MKRSKRIWAILISALALVALVLLAAGLQQMSFSPGYPLAFQRETGGLMLGGAGPGEANLFLEKLIRGAIMVALILIPFLLLYMIVSPEGRKWALRSLGVVVTLLAVYYILRAPQNILPGAELEPPLPLSLDNAALLGLDLTASPPPWLAWAMALVLALFAAVPLVGVAWLVWRSRRRRAEPLEGLAREAENTLDALRGGSDLRDAVMRCYYEMSRVLSNERGITRERAMTPREFEGRLGEAGLPEQQIRDLTRLFEGVRYGARVPGEREEEQAIHCLNAIVAACRSAA